MLSRLQPNLREYELRRDVDLGHLVVMLELVAGITHGIAVGIDLALMAVYSSLTDRGFSTRDRDRVLAVIDACGARISHPLLTAELVREAVARTARQRGGNVNLPVPLAFGRVEIQRHVDAARMARAVTILRRLDGLT
jgi:3-dehydroquinate synthetase